MVFICPIRDVHLLSTFEVVILLAASCAGSEMWCFFGSHYRIRKILTNSFKLMQVLLVNMDRDRNDSITGTRSGGNEVLPEEIVRYLRDASSQERQAIRSLVDEFESESEFEHGPPDSDGSESQPEINSEQSPEDSLNNDTVEESASSTGQSDDPPDDVPANATLTVKEINDNRYYYWQWRDGDSIRSKYKGPV